VTGYAPIRVCPVCGDTFTARLLASGKRQVTCSRNCMRGQPPGVITATGLGWMDRAACRTQDPDLWFEKEGVAARGVCNRCPVAAECLGYALRCEGTEGPAYRFGIYGGTAPGARAQMAKAGMS
jgi:Transcription factor WhiB